MKKLLLVILLLSCFFCRADAGITVETVSGRTYTGYILIVDDPSRVFVGVNSSDFSLPGLTVDAFVEKFGAVAGINASGFEDKKSHGRVPYGTVISQGKLLKEDTSRAIAAFDADGVLHVGSFDRHEVEALGLRDGAGWGPALIVNGEVQKEIRINTGLNPRSAVGQRADGAVLFLELDGRYPSSLGASYEDMIDVLLRYGAVNACNMDGGNSAAMFYEGQELTVTDAGDRVRQMPTVFLVKPASDGRAEAVPLTRRLAVPEGCVVSVNGAALSAEDAVPLGIWREYRIDESGWENGVTVTDASGKALDICDVRDMRMAVYGAEDMPQALKERAYTVLETVAKYVAGLRDVGSTYKCIQKGSSVERALSDYGLWKSRKATKAEYKNFVCDNYIRPDERTFFCNVHADYVCRYQDRSQFTYSLFYTFCFTLEKGTWMLYDMYTW